MNTQAPAFTARQGFHYGLLGLPLAFVALPLYVILPHHYATQFGVPLATLGALLLGARLLDAFIDPLLGKWCDRLFRQSIAAVLVFGACAAVLLASGFAALLFPLLREGHALLAWAGAALVLTYTAYSALSIAHQSWGAMLGGGEAQRARIVGWREGWGLLGVVLAAVAPTLLGLPATAVLFTVALCVGWWFWSRAPRPVVAQTLRSANLWLPFRRAAFRRLLGVFVLNGIASAVPATLVLFFVQDLLQAPRQLEPAFLGGYFLCAALSLPLWMRSVRRIGLARTWLVGMLLAIVVFVFASRLQAGESMAFLVVCVLSGVALGADLALPGALLAGVIAEAGDRGQSEGAYFGWWNFATKMNLALAAGLGLPLLALFGYVPGARDPQALHALVVAYCLVPCALKLTAAATLYGLVIRPAREAGAQRHGVPLDEAR